MQSFAFYVNAISSTVFFKDFTEIIYNLVQWQHLKDTNARENGAPTNFDLCE